MTAASEGAVRVWGRIEAADPPFRRHRFDQLLKMARRMLATRQDRFPALVASGEMSAADAAFEIAVFEDLVADWAFIDSRGSQGEPAPAPSLTARRAYLAQSIDTIAAIAAEAGGFSKALHAQAECVIALAWHAEPGRDQVGLTRLTHQLRAEAAAANTSREPAACN